jgi:predicted Zn-ribbon and HTH transcriptional regulator
MRMPWSSWLTTMSKPMCNKCGWQGEKTELVTKQVRTEVLDNLSYPIQSFLAYSPPTHRIEYRCPKCKELLASDLKFYQSFYDQETFVD